MDNPAGQGGSESRLAAPRRTRLEGAAAAILALGLVYFVFLFFPWNALCLALGPGRGQGTVCVSEFGTVSGWDGVGILAGLLVAVLLVWEGTAVAGGLELGSPVTRPAIAAGLARAARAADLPRGVLPVGYGLRFDRDGNNTRSYAIVMQWQDGRRETVPPPELATAAPRPARSNR